MYDSSVYVSLFPVECPIVTTNDRSVINAITIAQLIDPPLFDQLVNMSFPQCIEDPPLFTDITISFNVPFYMPELQVAGNFLSVLILLHANRTHYANIFGFNVS